MDTGRGLVTKAAYTGGEREELVPAPRPGASHARGPLVGAIRGCRTSSDQRTAAGVPDTSGNEAQIPGRTHGRATE